MSKYLKFEDFNYDVFIDCHISNTTPLKNNKYYFDALTKIGKILTITDEGRCPICLGTGIVVNTVYKCLCGGGRW